MRNVPVGAGRRKNKNSSSHYRHITISEALQAARIGAANGTHHALKSNGRVLSFGIDPPICDSVASVLNLGDSKKALSGTRNGFHNHTSEEQKIPVSGENGEDCSSSITVSNFMEETGKSTIQETFLPNNGFGPQQVQCFSSVPWPYPWGSGVPSQPQPALCPPGFFYPAAPMWNWSVPWFSSHTSAPHQMSPSSGSNSPTLGKHSRNDDDMVKEQDLQQQEEESSRRHRNGCVLVPKTLRIDDPDEAAKSSIWATLGIKNECVNVSGGGMFKAFQSKKKEEKNHVLETSSVLLANPAALSRSLNFHENT